MHNMSKLCYDRGPVGQSVLGSEAHLEPQDKTFITVEDEGLLQWGALSDEMTGLSFTTALALVSAVNLGTESHGTLDHILLSQILDFPNLGGGPRF
jgi:hypothetical protein